MRVGIDARFLTHPQQGGFKSYTENLLRGLAEIDRSNQYVVYTDRRVEELPFDPPANFSIRPIRTPGAVGREQIALPAAMVRDRIDVAHYLCNTGPLFPLRPMVLTVHDLLSCSPGWLSRCGPSPKSMAMCAYWRYATPTAARRAAHVITISASSQREIINRLSVHPDSISVIPTGVHPAFCVQRDEYLLDEVRKTYSLPSRYLLAFASSDGRKNLRGVLSAWDKVRLFVPECWLVTVCASPSAIAAVNEHCAGSPQAQRVAILTELPRRDLALLYNGADALLFPSFYEGFGLPVVEAMACGTPVVTSNVSALPEVAGDAALQVDPSDIPSLAKCIMRLLPDEELRRELVARGVRRAALYSWDRTVSETLKVYRKVYERLHVGELEAVR